MTAKLLTTHIPITHFLLFKELFFSHVPEAKSQAGFEIHKQEDDWT